jgi:hypothetical protein
MMEIRWLRVKKEEEMCVNSVCQVKATSMVVNSYTKWSCWDERRLNLNPDSLALSRLSRLIGHRAAIVG